MRLWHYKLIPVLPNQMLVSQWRECIAIKRQWEKGTLKHRLVSYVMNHSKEYFIWYCEMVTLEMNQRKINYQHKYLEEILRYCDITNLEMNNILYYPEHNNRYLKQCYYNLQEKYDRGIIAEEEWQKIDEYYTREVMGYVKV